MRLGQQLLTRMFGHPSGVLGYLGGKLMEGKGPVYRWVLTLLDVQSTDHILEVGFGPGVGIESASAAAPDGFVAGVDYSEVMLKLACRRNARGIAAGKVALVHGSATDLPYADNLFTKALSVNSLHLWPDPVAGLKEMHRVLEPGGAIAITFTPQSGESGDNLVDLLRAAGFKDVDLSRGAPGVSALARKER